MSRMRRAVASGAALALLALGLLGDVGSGDPWSFGPLQRALVATGLLILPLALFSGSWLHRHAVLVFIVVSSYATLLAFEVALDLTLGPDRNRMFALVGVYRPARWGGYEMAPGWSGFYDDGRTRAAVDLNSLGDRDDELDRQPRNATRLVILLGDSQTFGMGLAREATIEGQLESLSAGRVAAYNLGVPGYGPWDSFEHYRERSLPGAADVLYLLYGNDLSADNCRSDYHTAYEGFIVTRIRPDGTPYGPDELRENLRAARNGSSPHWSTRLKGIALLEHLHDRVRLLRDPERMLLAGRPGDFSEACSLRAAEAAAEMQALARERGQHFAVAVLPTRAEATLQRHAAPMRATLAALERLAIPTVPLLRHLSPSDYLPRDEHLAPSGARKVAEAILD